MAEEAELKSISGGGKKKLFIVVGAVALLLVVGLVVFFMMGSGGGEDSGSSPEAQQKLMEANKIYYVTIPSPIVLKVQSKPKPHIMQLKLVLMVRGDENRQLAEHHLPAILGAITDEMFDLDFAMLQTEQGKIDIKERAQRSVQARMKQLENKPVVEKILYDGFIVQ